MGRKVSNKDIFLYLFIYLCYKAKLFINRTSRSASFDSEKLKTHYF